MASLAGEVVDESAIQRSWHSRGFSCDVWSDPPGQVWSDFVHATDELVMLVSGEMELTVSGSTLQPRPGEEIFIPAGASHTVVNTGSVTNRWLYGYGHAR